MNSENVNPAPEVNSISRQPEVLLVHGMWSLPETLWELRDAFVAMGYGVESLCLPHHYEKSAYNGDRKARLAKARLEDYVDHIVERIRQKSRPPILVGHSMGALLAQLAAAREPCDRLILLSSAAPAGINGLGLSVIRTLGRNLLRFPLWKTVTEVSLAQVRYGIANAQTPSLQQHIAEHCTYESGMAWNRVRSGDCRFRSRWTGGPGFCQWSGSPGRRSSRTCGGSAPGKVTLCATLPTLSRTRAKEVR